MQEYYKEEETRVSQSFEYIHMFQKHLQRESGHGIMITHP